MSRNRKKKVFDGQFVGITAVVLDSPAWKAMSPHARLVYIAIKRNWDHTNNNNGRLYLAGRSGAEKTGFSPNTIWKCIGELIHFGFAVVTKGATLGVDGSGRPTYLRLTEMGTRAEPVPTRDFLKWDGVLFDRPNVGARNFPPRPDDGQAGNGVPGRKQNRTPHQAVRRGAPSREALAHQAVRHSGVEVHQPVRHTDDLGAPSREANLVSATRVSKS
jgi:hypothetical protein